MTVERYFELFQGDQRREWLYFELTRDHLGRVFSMYVVPKDHCLPIGGIRHKTEKGYKGVLVFRLRTLFEGNEEELEAGSWIHKGRWMEDLNQIVAKLVEQEKLAEKKKLDDNEKAVAYEKKVLAEY